MSGMTADLIKQRLESAGKTIMMLPVPKNGMPQGHQAQWPQVVRTYHEWFVAQVMADRDNIEEMMAGRNAVKIRANQKQMDELDEVLGWIWHIKDGRRRRIVTLKSLKNPITDKHIYGWRRLGRDLGLHENSIRYQYAQGIGDILVGITSCRPALQNGVNITKIGQV